MWNSLLTILLGCSQALAKAVGGPLSTFDLHRPETSEGNTSINRNTLFGSLADRSFSNSFLLSRQEKECPPGESFCPDGLHCVESGYFCCSNQAWSCPDGGQCCYDGSIHCTYPDGFCCGPDACLAGETCCAPYGCGSKGSTCCGQGHYCDPGTTCCPDESGCVDSGYTCCGQYQCNSGEQCCSGAGCAPKTGTCCGKGYYCEEGYQCCQDQDGDSFCSTPCIETFIVDRNDYDDPDFDEIFENMCRGILRSTQYQANRPNEMIVEYNGQGSSLNSKNRVAAGCRGAGKLECAKVFSDGTVKWSCDEFPFASTKQGGSNAAVICIPNSINFSIGGKWGNFVKGKKGGANFRIKIKNFDCSKITDRRTRSALFERAGILANNTNALYLNGSIFGNYSQGSVALIIPLNIPDDFVGIFNMDYTIAKGSLISGSIIDDDGMDYGDIKISNSGQTATGSIDVGPDGVGNAMILGWANDIQVTLNISTSLSTSTTTTLASQAATPTLTLSDISTLSSQSMIPTGLKSGATDFIKPPIIRLIIVALLGLTIGILP